MGRLHLFEFEDQKWFPSTIRKGTTDFLMFVFSKTNGYRPVIPLIKKVMDKSGDTNIIDLCSGSGGGIEIIQKELSETLGKKVKVTLTDKYPNLTAFNKIKNSNQEIDFIQTEVDATNVPKELDGFRTIFTAFHHFKPDMAESILRDAVEKKVPIGVFELGNRGLLEIIKLFITVPIGLFLVTPFLRPVKLSKIILTYIIPLIPLCTIWDGIASMLRVYFPEDLNKLIEKINAKDYVWETGTVSPQKGRKGEIVYLIGYPQENNCKIIDQI